MSMMSVKGFDAFYGRSQALRNFTIDLKGGEVLCLLGRNGAGKTTALKTIMGTVRPASGTLTLDGKDLTGLPAKDIPRAGIGYVPQGRRLFTELTVWENLGALHRQPGRLHGSRRNQSGIRYRRGPGQTGTAAPIRRGRPLSRSLQTKSNGSTS
jgi:branched-chain amino acid transport system ATP-binding protein